MKEVKDINLGFRQDCNMYCLLQVKTNCSWSSFCNGDWKECNLQLNNCIQEQSQPEGSSEEQGWQWLYADFIEVLVKTWDGWWYLQVKIGFYLSSGEHLVKNLEFTEYFSCGKGHSELRVLIEAEGENNWGGNPYCGSRWVGQGWTEEVRTVSKAFFLIQGQQLSRFLGE